MRRGLSTSSEEEAERLVEQLNQLLATPAFWSVASRDEAGLRFDPRVVSIFYDGLEPRTVDYEGIREQILPLPTIAEGYKSVLFLGTTGAGKTTVVRQILGTHPVEERFPSTSTAKTTIADSEIVLADGPFRVVVTFTGRDEVTDHLADCVSEAALAIHRGAADAEVYRRLLDHVNQRLRFSYVLGRPTTADVVDDDDDELGADACPSAADRAFDSEGEFESPEALLGRAATRLRTVVQEHRNQINALVQDERDERAIAEIIEDLLDTELRRDEKFNEIVDWLIEAVELRFAPLANTGSLIRDRQGWPESWAWESSDREQFIRTTMRFSSNYAAHFGRLLTPLVNGIRVAGPFCPQWWDNEPPRLVLLDGEGLGHTPNSGAALSTGVANRLSSVDAIVLVDNAMQPMQAAPVAALKSIVTSGNASKVFFCFTHFDQVGGPNLPGVAAKQEHILASAENVLKAVGEDLGPFAERILRKRLDHARFFLGGIQDELDSGKRADGRTVAQLRDLVERFQLSSVEASPREGRPVYDRMNLVLAVSDATRSFHRAWRGRLGLEPDPNAPKEHWTRIKAMSRRLAEGWADEYDTLKPVASLRQDLQNQIYQMLQQPLRWAGSEPNDDQMQLIIDELSNALTRGLSDLAGRRIASERVKAWREAYAQSGRGSTFVRAELIAGDVYEKAAPIPTSAASLDQNTFLHDVANLVDEVMTDYGALFS